MKVKLTKDWAGYSKGDSVEITDVDALKKGFSIKLFEGKATKNLETTLSEEEEETSKEDKPKEKK